MARSSDREPGGLPDDDLAEEHVTRILPRPAPSAEPSREGSDTAPGTAEPAAQSGDDIKVQRVVSPKMLALFLVGLLLGALVTAATIYLVIRRGDDPPVQAKVEPLEREDLAKSAAKNDPPANDAAKSDVEKLQGTWLVVSFEIDGRQENREGLRLTHAGNKFATLIGNKVVQAGTFTIDATAQPKAMDYVVLEGNNKGQTFKCIYRVEGGVLTACGTSKGSRPKEFATTRKAGDFLRLATREDALPDLVIDSLSVDQGGQVVVRVKNVGLAPVPDSVWTKPHAASCGVYLRALDSKWAGGKSIWGFDPQKALQPPGGTAEYRSTLKIGRPTRITVSVDHTNQVQESNEANNTRTETLTPEGVAEFGKDKGKEAAKAADPKAGPDLSSLQLVITRVVGAPFAAGDAVTGCGGCRNKFWSLPPARFRGHKSNLVLIPK